VVDDRPFRSINDSHDQVVANDGGGHVKMIKPAPDTKTHPTCPELGAFESGKRYSQSAPPPNYRVRRPTESATSYFPDIKDNEPDEPDLDSHGAVRVPKVDASSAKFWAAVAVLFSVGYALGKCSTSKVNATS
jgi:hypothetical protein